MQNDCETVAFADLERSKRGRAPSEPLPFTSILQFLSMKLATMNPQLDFDSHYMPSKDVSIASENTFI
jgi:hypothetical protein